MGLEDDKSSPKDKPVKSSTRNENSAPTSLPDAVAATSALNPSQTAKISTTETRPAVGRPSSARASGAEGIVSDNRETNQRQMTNPSPGANPGATQPRISGQPTMNVSELPGGVMSHPLDDHVEPIPQAAKKETEKTRK